VGVPHLNFEPALAPSAASTGTVVSPRHETATKLRIDRKARIVRGACVITRGPAAGHGFDIDDVMLRQVSQAIADAGPAGIKSRFTHASDAGPFSGGVDPIEVVVGRCRNAVLDGDCVRADIHIGSYADDSPSGKLATYLMNVAEEDPAIIGLSIVFSRAPFEERRGEGGQTLPPAARLRELLAVDFVGDPGANPDGLL
jgi:hypothetical protein